MNPTTELIADAFIIADSAARSDIEVWCLAILDRDQRRAEWYDTTRLLDREDEVNTLRTEIDRAVRYLTARDKLIRQPGAPHMVRFP